MKNGTFSLASENPPIPGCTVSGEVLRDTLVFSLAADTDISPESYPVRKLWLAVRGEMTALAEQNRHFHEGDLYVTPIGVPVGIQADADSVYTEILLRKETSMNPMLKFVIMAFDEGTGLSEHAAPGEALIFALDGHGVIGYEGKEYPIQAGENFRFAKNGAHWVKADGKFKMALLLLD